MNVDLKVAIPAGLKCRPGKPKEEIRDGGAPGCVTGLYVEVRENSTAELIFRLLYKKNRVRIGKVSEITVTQARKLAMELKAKIDMGATARKEELPKQEELTLSQLYHQHYAIYIVDRKKTVLRDSQLWKRVEPVFGNTKLSALTKMDLEIFASSLLREGLARATCNLHLRLIRHMLYLACDWNMLAKNPAAKIKMFAERNQVNNYMDQPTLQRFLGAVQSYDNPMIQAAILFLLSTAARTQEALKAKWTHIDLGNRTWFIPAEDAKSGKSRILPLSDAALASLAKAKELAGADTKGDGYVFRNTATGDRFKSVRAGFNRIKIAAGLPKLRPHDLRHQALSMLCSNGASAHLAMAVSGHSQIQTLQRYLHASGDEILRYVNKNGSQITTAMALTAEPAVT